MDNIIISLTSYPARINNVDKTIKTLLIQNMRPDKIILWLAKEEFIHKKLPQKLLELCQYGLEIRWCDNLKSHKKYFYVMQEYPESVIITVDDDVYYSPRMVEILYNSYLKFPNAVSCLRANKIIISNGKIAPYSKWDKGYTECTDLAVMDLLPVGMGGVLYPPHCMPKETFDKKNIQELCENQDDLWLKVQEIRKGILTVLVNATNETSQLIENTQDVGLYENINLEANDVAIKNICSFYFKDEMQLTIYLKNIYCDNNTSDKAYTIKKMNREKRVIKCIDDSREIVIYGAGVGAMAVYENLLPHIKKDNIRCFVVTDKNSNPKELYGIPVRSIDELAGLKKDMFIIVSTAEKYQDDIRLRLKELKFNNIWYVKDQLMFYLTSNSRVEKARKGFLMSVVSDDEFEK